MIPYEWIGQAEQRIGGHIRQTPLTYDAARGLYLKWENQQVTGSFKPRGALNKILSLEEWERSAGLVTASAGNHGQGVALAGRITSAPVEVFVSEHAVPGKVQAMRELGAQVHDANVDRDVAARAALRFGDRHHGAAQAPTLLRRLNRQHPEIGAVSPRLEIHARQEPAAVRVDHEERPFAEQRPDFIERRPIAIEERALHSERCVHERGDRGRVRLGRRPDA